MYNIRHSAALILVAGLAISACGGRNDGDVSVIPPPTPAPDPLSVVAAAAATSVDALVTFLLSLSTLTAQAETREAIDVSALTLAQSDTTEPTTIP